MLDFVTCTVNGEQMTIEKGAFVSELLTPRHKVEAVCGGRGICKKCRVLAFGALSAPNGEEQACFSAEELKQGYRLACCTRVEGPCRIETVAGSEDQICADGALPDFVWSPQFRRYGAAIDIGTTTLALRIYGEACLLAQVSAPNPQAVYGADVMSRISASVSGKAQALQEAICTALGKLLEQAAQKAQIAAGDIDFVAICGNTAMLYFLTGRDVTSLSHAPFEADHLFGETVSAAELGLPCRDAQVYLAPCISAYVGGDITMALLASALCHKDETALLCDIGTNGEMALWHKGALSVCSTAAGPAFEGAGLSCGMRGASGAVDKVSLRQGRLVCHTIGEGEPCGICGSGVIDALACLLKTEAVDETGYLAKDPAVLTGRVQLTGQDIRNVQLAKAAIRAGMETLLQLNDIGTDELAHLDIAGGFGQYLNIESAAYIGLLPSLPKARIRILGNAAISGAAMVLLKEGAMDEATRLAQTASTVELASNPVFTEHYMDEMFF